MKFLNYKYTIIYTIICLFLFWALLFWYSYLVKHFYVRKCREGLTDFEKYSHKIIPYPQDAVINYNDVSSPLYSHTVDLPINNPISCKNFCGPKSQCAITREQCTSDIDCQGCQPPNPPVNQCLTKDVDPYEDSGKLGQTLTYSNYTRSYGTNADEIYPGSKDEQLTRSYQGVDMWTPSFNKGLELYNKRQTVMNAPSSSESAFLPNYPETITATGLFYNTGPTASNVLH